MLLAQTQRSVPPEMSSLLSSHLVHRGFYPLRYYKRVSKGITLQYLIVVMLIVNHPFQTPAASCAVLRAPPLKLKVPANCQLSR